MSKKCRSCFRGRPELWASLCQHRRCRDRMVLPSAFEGCPEKEITYIGNFETRREAAPDVGQTRADRCMRLLPGAARAFLVERGVADDRAQKVWDNIALHTWDMNQFRGDTSRLMQRGLAYDVSGVPDAKLNPADVAEVIRRYPRLKFKHAFNERFNHEADCKQPCPHWFHICSRIEHNRSPLTIVDAPVVLDWAPFDE